jgi:hypothetical protein
MNYGKLHEILMSFFIIKTWGTLVRRKTGKLESTEFYRRREKLVCVCVCGYKLHYFTVFHTKNFSMLEGSWIGIQTVQNVNSIGL